MNTTTNNPAENIARVRPVVSARSGEPVRNQYRVVVNGIGTFFQSYDSVVAFTDGDTLTLGRHWDYSVTTMKHLNSFLRDALTYGAQRRLFDGADINSKSIRAAIDAGRIEYNPDMV